MHWSLPSGFGIQVAMLLGILIMAFIVAFATRKKSKATIISLFCVIAAVISLFFPGTVNGDSVIPFALLMTAWLAGEFFKTNKELQTRIETLEQQLKNK